MTSDELRAKFGTAYKIILRERRMREHVFRNDPTLRGQKLAEMDRLLEILVELKDFCKEHCDTGYEQPVLLDPSTGSGQAVPKKADYI